MLACVIHAYILHVYVCMYAYGRGSVTHVIPAALYVSVHTQSRTRTYALHISQITERKSVRCVRSVQYAVLGQIEKFT